MPLDLNQALDIPYTEEQQEAASKLRQEAYPAPSQTALEKLSEGQPNNDNNRLLRLVGEEVSQAFNSDGSIFERVRKAVDVVVKQMDKIKFETTRIAGDKAQQDLYKFAITPGDTRNANIAPEVRRSLELRAEVQKELGKDWRLVQTQKDSPADLAGMDYLLINVKDGRYFMLDSTLNMDAKANLPALRKDGVIEIKLNEDGSPDIATKERFMERVLHLMKQPSALNMLDTPPPPILKTPLEQVETELAAFRRRLTAKADKLEADAQSKSGTEQDSMREQAQSLRDFNFDLKRLKYYAERKIDQNNDQNLPKEQEAMAERVSKMVDRGVKDILAGKLKGSTNIDRNSLSVTDGARKFWVDPNKGTLTMRADGKDYVIDINKIVKDLSAQRLREAFAQKGSDDIYARRRILDSGSGVKAILERVLDAVKKIPTDELLGRNRPAPAPVVEKPAQPSADKTAEVARERAAEVVLNDARTVWRDLGSSGQQTGYSEEVVTAMELTALQQEKLWTADEQKRHQELIDAYKAEKDKPEGQRPTIDRVNTAIGSDPVIKLGRSAYEVPRTENNARMARDYKSATTGELEERARDLVGDVTGYPKEGTDVFARRTFIDAYIARAREMVLPSDPSKRADSLTKFVKEYFTGSKDSGGIGSTDTAFSRMNVVATSSLPEGSAGRIVFKNGTQTFTPSYREGDTFVVDKGNGMVDRIPVSSTSIELQIPESKLKAANTTTPEGQWALREIQATLYHELQGLNQLKNRAPSRLGGETAASKLASDQQTNDRSAEYIEFVLNGKRLTHDQKSMTDASLASTRATPPLELAMANDVVTRFLPDGRIEVVERGKVRELNEREADSHIRSTFDSLIADAREKGDDAKVREYEQARSNYTANPAMVRSRIMDRMRSGRAGLGTAAGVLILVSAALNYYVQNDGTVVRGPAGHAGVQGI